MVKKILSAICLASVLFTVTSCEKDDPYYDIEDVSKLKMLSYGYWDLYDYTIIYDVDAEEPQAVSVYSSIPSCQLDDIYEFTLENEMIKHESFTKCAVNDPDSVVTYFTLSEQESKIVMYGNPEDVSGSTMFSGEIYYPSVNDFYWTYKTYNEGTEKTERHTFYFAQREVE